MNSTEFEGNRSDISNENSDTVAAVDAVIHVSTSAYGLEAYVNIEPPHGGGCPPTLEMLKAALKSHEISYNIDEEKLKELEERPVYNCNILVARGVTPINGLDGTASFQIEIGKKTAKPKENENGMVDFRDLGITENVEMGQILCIITPPTEGDPGISVKGEKLLQRKGRPVPSYLGKNTELINNGTAIVAKKAGQVEFDGRKINVDEMFYVKGDIDSSTGNIKVVGGMSVSGMVKSGFEIEAGEDVFINGIVENATIKAGGSVKLQSGMIGSTLYCEGDLNCSFIENSNVFVKGNITVGYILNSDIRCGKNLHTIGKHAKIIGGSCMVGQDITAKTIGSITYVKTILELGTDYNMMERQQALRTEIPELEKKIECMRPVIKLLNQLEENNRLTPEKKIFLDQAVSNYETTIRMQEEDCKELEKIVNNKGYGQIVCSGTMYPGTTAVMGTARFMVTQAITNTSLYYDEGEIAKGIAQ